MTRCAGGGTIGQGVLTVGSVSWRSVDALLALPAATSASKLRVRMVVGDVNGGATMCTSGGGYRAMRTGVVAVVGANGEASTPLNLACDGAMADHVIELPKASPLWLVVHIEGYSPMPYNMPMPYPPAFTIDEVQFE
jgi:hypothetical protein